MSAYKSLKFKITGVAPLLMHNGQTADPLNPHSRAIAEITSKRKKTEADHAEIARREWYAGLYLHGSQPCIPAEAIEAALVKGAMKEKQGPKGPRDPDDLWQNETFRLRVPAKVGTSRVIRTRPIFREWSAELVVKFLPSLLNEKDVRSFLVTAGEQIGLLDWRPRFGRFSVSR
jgi:hypothetical protein